MNSLPQTLTNQFIASMRDPLVTADDVYVTQFWRPYLGANAFALWDVMTAVQPLVEQGVYERWPTVNALSQMTGVGDRYTILGRAATKTRPSQQGTLDLLVDENLVVGFLRGNSKKGRRYVFEVQDCLPLLTPRQAKRLDTAVAKAHRRYLEHAGVLEEWSGLLHKTLVRPPGSIR